MQRLGRKPMGSALVQRLDGSQRAKLRLEVILDTLAGRLKIAEACQRLGIGEAMFHRVRMEVLEAALAHLEPRPVGRPPRETTADSMELAVQAERIEALEAELHLAEVRQEIAQVMPHLVDDPPIPQKKRPVESLEVERPTVPGPLPGSASTTGNAAPATRANPDESNEHKTNSGS